MTDSDSYINTDIYINNNELNTNNNYSNITEWSIRSIETDEVSLEGSLVNTTIYSIIDELGYLQSVFEKSTSVMKPPDEENDNENDDDTEYTYSQIYNDNNQISLSQVKENEAQEIKKIMFLLVLVIFQRIARIFWIVLSILLMKK